MSVYLNVIKRNVIDILDVNEVNEFIKSMNIADNSKRIYAYYYKKFLKENKEELLNKVIDYKQEFKKIDSLTENQIELIRKVLKSDLEKYIFELFLLTGIRIGEYDNLINSEIIENTVYFKCPKNKKWRYAVLTDVIINLQNNLKTKFLSKKQIRKVFDKISKNAQELKIINFKLTPHMMRHTCGTLLRIRGVDYDDIADYLADEAITVKKYYITLNGQYMKQIGLILTNKWDEVFDLATARKIILRQNKKLMNYQERIKFLEHEIKKIQK